MPLIINYPGALKPGEVSKAAITSTDFYPTILELAGIPLIPEQHCDGVSFLPILKGKEKFNRGPIFWHFPHYGNQGGTPGSSVIEDKYKLIKFYEDNRLELYNLEDDISERINIASREPERADELNRKLTEWTESANARFPKLKENNFTNK